jgi:tRNA(fMet)-specific endonuclease VapC
MNYLLDTCVISELVAKRPHQKVVEWIDSVEEARLHLSVITIGEVQKGIVKLPDSQRRTVLEEWLNDQLLVRFAGRIVPIDTGVMLRWGQLTGALEVAGKTMPAIDSLIAAIALHGNFSLVTRNEDDFKYAGVPIVNPWS